MACNKIQVLEYPSGIPASLKVNGILLLDTDDDFALRQTRKAEELTEVNKISISASLGFSLPYSTKNFMCLGKYINPNVHDYNFKPLKVIAYSASNAISHSLLYVLNHDEGSGRFTCELRDDESHWVVGSKKLKLRDIPFDEFYFSRSQVESTWPLAEYEDGDAGIYFPLCFYGAWKEPSSATIADMRPWYHVLHLLKKGFAEIGWIFKSPIFDLPIAKKLIAYLLEPFDNTSASDAQRPNTFLAVKSSTTEFNSPETYKVVFEDEQYDINDVYDTSTGEFSSIGVFNFKFEVIIGQVASQFDPAYIGGMRWKIIRENAGDKYVVKERLDNFRPIPGSPGNSMIVGEVEKVTLSPDDVVYVELDMPGHGEMVMPGSIFTNGNVRFTVAENETFNPGKLIAHDYRLYDFFKGILHLFRGKVHTDHNLREIWLYPNYNTKWFDEDIEGYYQDESYSLIYQQQRDSSVVTSQNQDGKRYLRLQFKQTTDQRIQGLNYPADKPIFSKTVDLGEYFENDIEVNENPFFEPTVNDKVFSIRPLIIDPSSEFYIDLPFLVDNDEGLPSFKIAPRILIAHGYEEYTGANDLPSSWRWYGETVGAIPYASQFPNFKDAAGQEIKEKLTYGDYKEDLYSRFWKNWVFDTIVNTKVNILANLSPNQFFSLSFRKAYHVMSNGKSVYGRIASINDFDGCGDYLTPIDIIPSTGNVKAPVLEERSTPDECSGQNPILLVEKSGSTWTASSDESQITDTIISTTIEWRYFDEADWTVGDTVTNPDRPFIFRLTVELQLCGKKFRQKYIIPCDNTPAIQWLNVHIDPNDSTKWCISAEITGELNDPILSTTFTKSIDGGGSTPYTMGDPICGIDEQVCIEGEVQFDNDCPPIPLSACYEFPPVNINCNDNQPTVIIEHRGLGGFTFRRGGLWVSRPGPYFIEYRPAGGTDADWVKWDERSPADIFGEGQVRITQFWCDTCPKTCTTPLTYMEPMELPSGEFPMSAQFQIKDHMSFAWDWTKLNTKEKNQMKKWYKQGKGQEIATMHNKHDMSDYEFCCGDDLINVLKHVKKAIDDGTI